MGYKGLALSPGHAPKHNSIPVMIFLLYLRKVMNVLHLIWNYILGNAKKDYVAMGGLKYNSLLSCSCSFMNMNL